MASSTAQLITRNVSNIIQQQHGHTTDAYHPSIAVVIGVLSTMFSVTFLILLYAKHCTRPPQHDVNEDANLQPIMNASDTFNAIQYPPHPPSLTDHPLFIDRVDSGLDRTLVNALPSFPFSSLRGQKDGLECAVCLTRFVHADMMRLLPACRHVFHLHCLDVWLSLHATCPLCRHRVDILDASPAATCLALQEFLAGSPNSSFRQASLDQHGPILDRGAFEFYVQREPELPTPIGASARFKGNSARITGSTRFNGASARFNGCSARFTGSSARIGTSARFSGIFSSARRKDNQASTSSSSTLPSSSSVLQNENQKISGSSALHSESQRFNGSSRRLELPLNIIDRKAINGSSRFHNFKHHETIDEAENDIPCSIQEATEDQQNDSKTTGDKQDDTKIDIDEISTTKRSINSNVDLSIELFPHLYSLDEHLLQRLNHRIVISDMASCHHRWSDFQPSDVPYFDATTVDLRPPPASFAEDKKEDDGYNEKNGGDLMKKNVAKVGKGFAGGSARLCATKVADVESAYKIVSGQRRCMSEMSSVQRTPTPTQQHFVPSSNGRQWFRSLRLLMQRGASRSNINNSNSSDPSTSTHNDKPSSSPSEES